MFLDQYLTENDNVSVNGPKLDETGVLMAVMEAEETFADYTVALVRAEHESIVSENTQILNEAVRDWGEKIKEFFENLWNAVKKFATWVWAQITSVFMKRDAWVRRYKNEIKAGAKKASTNKNIEWKVARGAPDDIKDMPTETDVAEELKKNKVDDVIKVYDKLKDGVKDMNKTDIISGGAISTYVGDCLKIVTSISMKHFKNICDNVMKDIKSSKDKAIRAAKEKNNSAEVTRLRKLASYKVRVLQLSYKTTNRAYNYAYSICKKAYNFNTFGKAKAA